MNISNKYAVMIFKSDSGKYTVGLNNKKMDGTYDSSYFPIQFNKGVELENKTKILLKTAWLSFYNWVYQDKKGTKFFIKCSDFEIVEDEDNNKSTTKTESDPYAEYGETINIDNDFLE